jgi:hypothetical protein
VKSIPSGAEQAAKKLLLEKGLVTGHDPPRRIVPKLSASDSGFSRGKIAK